MLYLRVRLSFAVLCCLVSGVSAGRANGEETSAAGDAKNSSRRVADAATYNARGFAFKAKGKYDKAIANYDVAIRLDPTKALYFNNRGTAWIAKGAYDKAIADYDVSIRLKPKNIMAFHNRAVAWKAKGELDKAIADYDEAILLDPKKATSYYNRGHARFSTGEYKRVIDDYNEAIRLDPKISVYHNSLAWLLATCPDTKFRDGMKAVEHATRACELSRWKSDTNLGTLSAAYATQGDFEQAKQWLQKAIKLNPKAHKDIRAKMLEAYEAGEPYGQQVK